MWGRQCIFSNLTSLQGVSYNEIYKAYDWSNLSTMSSPCDWRAVEAYLIDMMGVWGCPLEEGSRDPNIDQGTDWEVLLGFWGHLFTGIQQVLGELTERRKHWNNYRSVTHFILLVNIILWNFIASFVLYFHLQVFFLYSMNLIKSKMLISVWPV